MTTLVAPALVGVSLTAFAAAAPAAPASSGSVGKACPSAYPLTKVTQGMTGTGLTVSKGTKPERFTAEVIGVMKSATGPGLDLVIVKADSPAIRRAGGIWAGMSGSPVYAADGRLIGAVSYTLSAGPTRIVGLTPAESMLSLLALPTAGATSSATSGAAATPAGQAARLSLPGDLQRKAVASGAASADAASSGMEQLPSPVAVTGLSEQRQPVIKDTLAHAGMQDAIVYAGSATAKSTRGSGSTVVPGGNFVGAISTGDVLAGAIGTATAVCDGKVVAFGHPLFGFGQTTMSAHLADALYVQPDPLFGPVKFANVTTLVGTLDQDRVTGSRALLGKGPAATEITSNISASTGLTRHGTTRASVPLTLSGIVQAHLLSNLDVVLQHTGEGSGQVGWTVTGTTSDGHPWTWTGRDRVADQFDITWAVSSELTNLDLIRGNRFTGVTFSKVSVDASVDETFRQYHLDGVEVKVGDRYEPVDLTQPLPVPAGSTLDLRAVLSPYQGRGEGQHVPFSFAVPADLEGQQVTVQLNGGAAQTGPDPTQATSFQDLLDRLQKQPERDQLYATAMYGAAGGSDDVKSARLDQVVDGSLTLDVTVTPPSPA